MASEAALLCSCLMFDIIISLFSAILVHGNSFLCLYTSYYSSIILTKFVTYYSQNYAGIIGSGLRPGLKLVSITLLTQRWD